MQKNLNNKLKKIRKDIDELQFQLEKVEIQQNLEIEDLFHKFENNKKNAEQLNEILEENRDNLKFQCEILYDIERIIKLKRKELEQCEIEFEKQELYLRKQYIQPKKNIFYKVVLVIIIVLLSLFISFLTPSIKKRIEYNPYVTSEKTVFVENYINEYEGEKTFDDE